MKLGCASNIISSANLGITYLETLMKSSTIWHELSIIWRKQKLEKNKKEEKYLELAFFHFSKAKGFTLIKSNKCFEEAKTAIEIIKKYLPETPKTLKFIEKIRNLKKTQLFQKVMKKKRIHFEDFKNDLEFNDIKFFKSENDNEFEEVLNNFEIEKHKILPEFININESSNKIIRVKSAQKKNESTKDTNRREEFEIKKYKELILTRKKFLAKDGSFKNLKLSQSTEKISSRSLSNRKKNEKEKLMKSQIFQQFIQKKLTGKTISKRTFSSQKKLDLTKNDTFIKSEEIPELKKKISEMKQNFLYIPKQVTKKFPISYNLKKDLINEKKNLSKKVNLMSSIINKSKSETESKSSRKNSILILGQKNKINVTSSEKLIFTKKKQNFKKSNTLLVPDTNNYKENLKRHSQANVLSYKNLETQKPKLKIQPQKKDQSHISEKNSFNSSLEGEEHFELKSPTKNYIASQELIDINPNLMEFQKRFFGKKIVRFLKFATRERNPKMKKIKFFKETGDIDEIVATPSRRKLNIPKSIVLNPKKARYSSVDRYYFPEKKITQTKSFVNSPSNKIEQDEKQKIYSDSDKKKKKISASFQKIIERKTSLQVEEEEEIFLNLDFKSIYFYIVSSRGILNLWRIKDYEIFIRKTKNEVCMKLLMTNESRDDYLLLFKFNGRSLPYYTDFWPLSSFLLDKWFEKENLQQLYETHVIKISKNFDPNNNFCEKYLNNIFLREFYFKISFIISGRSFIITKPQTGFIDRIHSYFNSKNERKNSVKKLAVSIRYPNASLIYKFGEGITIHNENITDDYFKFFNSFNIFPQSPYIKNIVREKSMKRNSYAHIKRFDTFNKADSFMDSSIFSSKKNLYKKPGDFEMMASQVINDQIEERHSEILITTRKSRKSQKKYEECKQMILINEIKINPFFNKEVVFQQTVRLENFLFVVSIKICTENNTSIEDIKLDIVVNDIFLLVFQEVGNKEKLTLNEFLTIFFNKEERNINFFIINRGFTKNQKREIKKKLSFFIEIDLNKLTFRIRRNLDFIKKKEILNKNRNLPVIVSSIMSEIINNKKNENYNIEYDDENFYFTTKDKNGITTFRFYFSSQECFINIYNPFQSYDEMSHIKNSINLIKIVKFFRIKSKAIQTLALKYYLQIKREMLGRKFYLFLESKKALTLKKNTMLRVDNFKPLKIMALARNSEDPFLHLFFIQKEYFELYKINSIGKAYIKIIYITENPSFGLGKYDFCLIKIVPFNSKTKIYKFIMTFQDIQKNFYKNFKFQTPKLLIINLNQYFLNSLLLVKSELYRKMVLPIGETLNPLGLSNLYDLLLSNHRLEYENNDCTKYFLKPKINCYKYIAQYIRKIDKSYAIFTVKKHRILNYWLICIYLPTTKKNFYAKFTKDEFMKFKLKFIINLFPRFLIDINENKDYLIFNEIYNKIKILPNLMKKNFPLNEMYTILFDEKNKIDFKEIKFWENFIENLIFFKKSYIRNLLAKQNIYCGKFRVLLKNDIIPIKNHKEMLHFEIFLESKQDLNIYKIDSNFPLIKFSDSKKYFILMRITSFEKNKICNEKFNLLNLIYTYLFEYKKLKSFKNFILNLNEMRNIIYFIFEKLQNNEEKLITKVEEFKNQLDLFKRDFLVKNKLWILNYKKLFGELRITGKIEKRKVQDIDIKKKILIFKKCFTIMPRQMICISYSNYKNNFIFSIFNNNNCQIFKKIIDFEEISDFFPYAKNLLNQKMYYHLGYRIFSYYKNKLILATILILNKKEKNLFKK